MNCEISRAHHGLVLSSFSSVAQRRGASPVHGRGLHQLPPGAGPGPPGAQSRVRRTQCAQAERQLHGASKLPADERNGLVLACRRVDAFQQEAQQECQNAVRHVNSRGASELARAAVDGGLQSARRRITLSRGSDRANVQRCHQQSVRRMGCKTVTTSARAIALAAPASFAPGPHAPLRRAANTRPAHRHMRRHGRVCRGALRARPHRNRRHCHFWQTRGRGGELTLDPRAAGVDAGVRCAADRPAITDVRSGVATNGRCAARWPPAKRRAARRSAAKHRRIGRIAGGRVFRW